MELTLDLYITITVRIAVLFACGGYLFYRWAKAPRRYYFDLPFLIGLSFTALAISKFFDVYLYENFYGEGPAVQTMEGHPGLVFVSARWLFILVVSVPLLYANLRVWVSERERARLAFVGAYTALFVVLIFQAKTFAALNALLPFMVLPVAAITIVTFLFIYARKRLPNVHGLLVGLGWAAYLVTNSVRPLLLANGSASMAELLDMLAWLIIFAGFIIRPSYARAIFVPIQKIIAK